MKSKFLLLLTIAFYAAFPNTQAYGVNKQKDVIQCDTITEAVIDVEYKKTEKNGIVWKDELEMARVLPTRNGKGIRITLPNSDPARVLILNKKGKKTLKAISYVAPAIIDISDLKPGEYQLILESHQVVVVKIFKKQKK